VGQHLAIHPEGMAGGLALRAALNTQDTIHPAAAGRPGRRQAQAVDVKPKNAIMVWVYREAAGWATRM
jgi:hypothetical protein